MTVTIGVGAVGFAHIVEAVVVTVEILEVWAAVTVGVGYQIVNGATIRGRLDTVGDAVGADRAIQTAIAVGISPRRAATFCDIENTIIVTIQIKAVSNAVAIGVAVVAGRACFRRIENAIVIIIQIRYIRNPIGIGVNGSSRVPVVRGAIAIAVGQGWIVGIAKGSGQAIDWDRDAVAIGVTSVINATIVVGVDYRVDTTFA